MHNNFNHSEADHNEAMLINNIIDSLIIQRRKKGMTQTDLAKAANLTQSVIARFESKKSSPRIDTVLKISAALNCEVTIVPIEQS